MFDRENDTAGAAPACVSQFSPSAPRWRVTASATGKYVTRTTLREIAGHWAPSGLLFCANEYAQMATTTTARNTSRTAAKLRIAHEENSAAQLRSAPGSQVTTNALDDCRHTAATHSPGHNTATRSSK